MVDFNALGEKLKNLVAGNKDKASQAVDKAGDVFDSKTEGKYSSVVDKVQDAAKGAIDKSGDAPKDHDGPQ